MILFIEEHLPLDDVVSLAEFLPSGPSLTSVIVTNCNLDDNMVTVSVIGHYDRPTIMSLRFFLKAYESERVFQNFDLNLTSSANPGH